MNAITNRAIFIGASLLITIVITSAIILVITQVTGIYQRVYNTDISIRKQYDEFSAFDHHATKTGMDLLNVVNKYRNDAGVKIFVVNNLDDAIETRSTVSVYNTDDIGFNSNMGVVGYAMRFKSIVERDYLLNGEYVTVIKFAQQ